MKGTVALDALNAAALSDSTPKSSAICWRKGMPVPAGNGAAYVNAM
ncbi:hypothetical protein [Paraburkholderia tagetis]|uniref:Uncharacterized protein n=1 Tax=Paraburkholderia tagetis TaxID=2913261 RepID=A0A9X1UNG0_9BURK|nr:hypothetical protein [Paraburkholderia tagetis]MCG5078671.1 hypothetical protein [Paraburkholderia tagetis]